MEDIGKRIAQARQAKGWNQSELARELGLSPQAVQKWETGESKPKGGRLEALARALGVTQQWLLGLEELPADSRTAETISAYRVEGAHASHANAKRNRGDVAVMERPSWAPVKLSDQEVWARDEAMRAALIAIIRTMPRCPNLPELMEIELNRVRAGIADHPFAKEALSAFEALAEAIRLSAETHHSN